MTDLELANRALMLLGVEPVGSLKDNNKPARTMKALIPVTKRTLLMEFPWAFATKIEPLTPAGGSPPPGWTKIFAWPQDALTVRKVYGGADFRGVADYQSIRSGGGRAIIANVDSGVVEYTTEVSDWDSRPADVLECFCARLASDAAVALTGAPQLAMVLFQKYQALAQSAAQTAVVEGNVPARRATQYVDVRK